MNKRLAAAALVVLLAAEPMYAGFAEVARALDAHRGVSRVWIPFLGLARLAVRFVQPEGVHDFQLVTFEGTGKVDPREMHRILQTKIGPGYTPLVRAWSKRKAEWSFVYVKPARDGKCLDLVVLARDDEDTVLVRVEVDASTVARELGNEPGSVFRIAMK